MSHRYESYTPSEETKEAAQRGLQLKSLGISLPEIAKILAREFPKLERGPEGRWVMMKIKYAGIYPFDPAYMKKISRKLIKMAKEMMSLYTKGRGVNFHAI